MPVSRQDSISIGRRTAIVCALLLAGIIPAFCNAQSAPAPIANSAGDSANSAGSGVGSLQSIGSGSAPGLYNVPGLGNSGSVPSVGSVPGAGSIPGVGSGGSSGIPNIPNIPISGINTNNIPKIPSIPSIPGIPGVPGLNGAGGDVSEVIDRVQQNGNPLSPRSLSVKTSVDSWKTGTQHWENWQGVDMGKFKDLYFQKDPMEEVKKFTSCQRGNKHTAYQIMFGSTTTALGPCAVYHRYLGQSVGLAMRCDQAGFPCGCFCQYADIIEYNFPAYQVNVSEQMFQSRYLIKDGPAADSLSDITNQEILGIPIGKLMGSMGGPMGILSILNNISVKPHLETLQKMDADDVASGLGGSISVVQEKAAQYGAHIGSGVDSKSYAQKAIASIKAFRAAHPEALYSAPSSTKQYSRNLVTFLNVMSAMFQTAPHSPQYQALATDLPDGYLYSKLINESKMGNMRSPLSWAQFMAPGGERSCILKNVGSGKSPAFYYQALLTGSLPGLIGGAISGIAGSVPGLGDDLCQKNVGDIFPYIDSRRPEITDGFFQGVMKSVNLVSDSAFMGGIGMGGAAHTFDKRIDNFMVLNDEPLKSELPQCDLIDNLAKPNVKFKKSNIKEERKGGENTMVIWPTFKGAVDYKGVPREYWLSGSCSGNITEFGGTKELKNKFRLK